MNSTITLPAVAEERSRVQHHLERILPAVLNGLADETDGVRAAALAAGRTMVELYADSALPLLLPAVEEGIVNDNWRIRQSSAELLGDLLFKARAHLLLSWGAGRAAKASWLTLKLLASSPAGQTLWSWRPAPVDTTPGRTVLSSTRYDTR